MDRIIVYQQQIPTDAMFLSTNQNAMVALALLAGTILGTATMVDGLACIPTTPASMSVSVGAGSIYSLQSLEATAYGSFSGDTTHQVLKQGIVLDSQAFSCPAPSTTGQSRVYLIQAIYQDVDTGAAVLPYYNASNPSMAYAGPDNTGVSQYTVRKGICTVAVKAGIAATTGTQTTPAPDAGYTGLYAITVANGQTTITSGNIAAIPAAPFTPTTLAALPGNVQNNAWTYFDEVGSATNGYVITPYPAVAAYRKGMKFAFRTTRANTGAATFATGVSPGPASLVRRDGSALLPGDIPAGSISEVEFDGTSWQLLSAPIHAGSTLVFSTGTATVPDAATRYFGQNHVVSTAEADVTFRLPYPARVSLLSGYAPSTTAGTRTYTVRHNGTDTALVATSTGSVPVGSDLTHYVDFPAGDEICIKLVTGGGSDVTIHKAVLMIERLG